MAGSFTDRRIRWIKKRYKRSSTEYLQSLLLSVDSDVEAKLIQQELRRR